MHIRGAKCFQRIATAAETRVAVQRSEPWEPGQNWARAERVSATLPG
jgi:hypothetical protein